MQAMASTGLLESSWIFERLAKLAVSIASHGSCERTRSGRSMVIERAATSPQNPPPSCPIWCQAELRCHSAEQGLGHRCYLHSHLAGLALSRGGNGSLLEKDC